MVVNPDAQQQNEAPSDQATPTVIKALGSSSLSMMMAAMAASRDACECRACKLLVRFADTMINQFIDLDLEEDTE